MDHPTAERFSGRNYVNLESYDGDGKPRRTPVQTIGDGGLLFLRTDPRTWKVRRIQSNPHVRVALCDRSGKTTGEWVDGDARVVENSERVLAMRAFRREYGPFGNLLIGFVGRLRGERLTTVISVKLRPPLPPQTPM